MELLAIMRQSGALNNDNESIRCTQDRTSIQATILVRTGSTSRSLEARHKRKELALPQLGIHKTSTSTNAPRHAMKAPANAYSNRSKLPKRVVKCLGQTPTPRALHERCTHDHTAPDITHKCFETVQFEVRQTMTAQAPPPTVSLRPPRLRRRRIHPSPCVFGTRKADRIIKPRLHAARPDKLRSMNHDNEPLPKQQITQHPACCTLCTGEASCSH